MLVLFIAVGGKALSSPNPLNNTDPHYFLVEETMKNRGMELEIDSMILIRNVGQGWGSIPESVREGSPDRTII